MKILPLIGSVVVLFALMFYSIGFAKEQRGKFVTNNVLLFFTLGVVFDITATLLMFLGSSKGGFTIHGLVGYSALAFMVSDTVFLWRHKILNGAEVAVSKALQIYTRITYVWWVVAFITGGLLAYLSRMHK